MSPQCRYGRAGHGCGVPVCPQSGMARRQGGSNCGGLLRHKGSAVGPEGPAACVCPGPAERSYLPRWVVAAGPRMDAGPVARFVPIRRGVSL
jgi:hypothetical protein